MAWQIFKPEKILKTYYDVKLKDGTVYQRCWPANGNFHTSKYVIHSTQILKVKESKL